MEHLQYKSNNINTKSILPYIYTIVNCHKTNFVEIIKVRYNRIIFMPLKQLADIANKYA